MTLHEMNWSKSWDLCLFSLQKWTEQFTASQTTEHLSHYRLIQTRTASYERRKTAEIRWSSAHFSAWYNVMGSMNFNSAPPLVDLVSPFNPARQPKVGIIHRENDRPRDGIGGKWSVKRSIMSPVRSLFSWPYIVVLRGGWARILKDGRRMNLQQVNLSLSTC